GLKVTQLSDFQRVDTQLVQSRLITCLAEVLGYGNRARPCDGTLAE
ncbi:MAG: hypothetical protein ACI9CB_002823, partial [Rhodothermales bacterium]